MTVALFATIAVSAFSLHSASSSTHYARFAALTLPLQALPAVNVQARDTTADRMAASPAPSAPEENTPLDPFRQVVADAGLSSEKLLAAFAKAGMTIAQAPAGIAAAQSEPATPIAERFHRSGETDAGPVHDPLSAYALTHAGLDMEPVYASSGDGPADQFQLAMATLALEAATAEIAVASAAAARTRPERSEMGRAAERPAAEEPPAAPARRPGRSPRLESQAVLAYARPDKLDGGAFNKLFNTPKAGNRVAIYDISAAVVHMPDGTKLEAHSGIGKMADNPRFVHVRNKGPTPPNTYKLTMRESLFHGVEAIRMTPVGDETMHGRDGILAHSYLLRGGRAESHGCVAFRHYDRFLKAFKQGKVTHMVVVPRFSDAAKVQLVSGRRG